MKKIPSVFERNFDGDMLLRDEVVPGCEWVLAGEGVPTVKWDGTACMVRDDQLFTRYDRKRNRKTGKRKPAPPGWEACEEEPNEHTGHWPGWVPVGEDEPQFTHHRHAKVEAGHLPDGTYELIGPKFQGNPQAVSDSWFVPHGKTEVPCGERTFEAIRTRLGVTPFEGIVFHHEDGRMAKVKRKDFGLPWPIPDGGE